VDERSLKLTSTTSQPIFVRPLSFFHHHLHSHHRHSPTTTPEHTATSPSPLLRDVGSTTNAPGCAERTAAAAAPPLSKGMWAAQYRSTEELGMDKHEGGPIEWEAPVVSYETRATTFVVARFRGNNPTDQSTRRKRIDTTASESTPPQVNR
jgi:hypothetical protein